MYKSTVVCDKCKKEETADGQYFPLDSKGWQEVKFEISQYEYRKYLFCLDCRKELGLFKEDQKSKPQIGTVADKLFEVISEIVANSVSGNG